MRARGRGTSGRAAHNAGLFDGLIVDEPTRGGSGQFIPGGRPSPGTEIKPGQRLSPTTELKPGQRLSPETEFKPGQVAYNKLPVGSETVRTDPKGKRRAWVKVGEPNRWRLRAVVVWERENEPVPKGMVVHHKDRNSLNDRLANLEILTRAEHANEHRSEVEQSRLTGSRRARAKVSPEDVVEIRRLFASGVHWRTIASRFGISKPSVHGITSRRTWKDIPEKPSIDGVAS
jgi:hypothetical protein